MKAADLAAIVLVALLAIGGIGGFLYMKAQDERAAAQRFEAAIDHLVDSSLGAARLNFVQPMLAAHPNAKLEALRTLYADQAQSDLLNLGYGLLRADWSANYERVAEQFGREVDDNRLQAEVDERYGPGAFALMRDQYRLFIADAPRRAAEEEARQQEQARMVWNAFEEYRRTHGQYPTEAVRIENGHVVEITH